MSWNRAVSAPCHSDNAKPVCGQVLDTALCLDIRCIWTCRLCKADMVVVAVAVALLPKRPVRGWWSVHCFGTFSRPLTTPPLTTSYKVQDP